MKAISLFLFMLPLLLWGQTHKIDSLKTELTKEEEDSTRVKLKLELSTSYRKHNLDSAKKYCQSAKIEIRRLPKDEFWLKAMRNLGISYYQSAYPDSALTIFEKALAQAKNLGEIKKQSFLLNNIGTIHFKKERFSLALNFYRQSQALLADLGDSNGQIVAINNQANVLMDLKQWEEAQQTYLQALAIVTRSDDKKHCSSILINIGLTYSQRGLFEEASLYAKQALECLVDSSDLEARFQVLDYWRNFLLRQGDLVKALDINHESLQIANQLQDQRKIYRTLNKIANIYTDAEAFRQSNTYLLRTIKIKQEFGVSLAVEYNNLGRNYMRLGLYDSALHYLHLSVTAKKKYKANPSIYAAYNLGSTYEKLNQLDSALYFLSFASQNAITTSRNNLYIKTLSLTSLGRVYFKQGKKRLALATFLEAYQMTEPYAYAKEKVALSKEIFDLYKNLGQPEAGIPYLEHHLSLQDSLFNQKNTQQLALRDAEYLFEKEREETARIQEAKIEKERTFRNNLWLTLLGFALLNVVLFLFFRNQRKTNRKLRRLNEEILVQKEIVEQQHLDLQSTQAKLVQAEKVASLGQMTIGIAHELKNPLNFVNNFARNVRNLAKELSEEFSTQKNRIENQVYVEIEEMLALMQNGSQSIVKNGKRADEIISSMMLHMRSTGGKVQPIDINQSLVNSAKLAYHAFKTQYPEREVEILQSLQADMPAIGAQKSELARALLNLLTNACEAVANTTEVAQVNLTSFIQNNSAIIEITDNGAGIAAENMPRLFDPFYTTKPTGKGNIGLGLSIAHDIIVGGHAGDISVQSEVGVGTTFRISLPLK